MKTNGKTNIIVVFVFDKGEVEKNEKLKSFFSEGGVEEERSPFIYFSDEIFEIITKGNIDISCYYYAWSILEDPTISPLEVAENLTSEIVEKLSHLESSPNEYFIFGIDHPQVKNFEDLIESMMIAKDDIGQFNLTVINPFNQKNGSGVMVDFEPFLEKKPKIDISMWN